ncbi:hypothetical protein NTGM5_770011 [Candidatus Nitrotoga sp. M5]|nr:hypothetical protein NTGM5_770011 [Candidatus Nitrotoga sp. M5]
MVSYSKIYKDGEQSTAINLLDAALAIAFVIVDKFKKTKLFFPFLPFMISTLSSL